MTRENPWLRRKYNLVHSTYDAKMLIEKVIDVYMLKMNKYFIFLDRENVREATCRKNSKCKMLTLKPFSHDASHM